MMETIVAILSKLGIPGLVAGSGLLGGLVVVVAKRYIPNFLGDWMKSTLSKELQPDIKDPKERELFVNMVKGICAFVGYKIPDKPGADKFKKVRDFLMRFVSDKYADDIVEIIEEAVKRLDIEITKAGEQ